MSVQNLHSLINGRWFIDKPYGHALLPSLFSILNGNNITIDSEELTPDAIISTKSGFVSMSDFDADSNQNEYVAIINLKDPIYKYNQECGPTGTKHKMKRMQDYALDTNCVGVVLDIDSGGGQVSGTPEFYDFISSFPKPVVSYTDGLMCSAAYYIGSAASHIIANKRADAIGSIGVMVHFIDVSGIYEKQGAKVITEYATQSTEKNKAFEELLKGKPELYIKTELDPLAAEFIVDIKAVRPGIDEEVFKGGTWNASDSLNKKLVDSLGTLQDAVDKVYELSRNTGGSNKSSKNKTNLKTKTMSKKTQSFPLIQGIIGASAEGFGLISTISGKKGTQITEEQLGKIEAALSGHDTAIKTEKDNVTAEKGKVAVMETAITTALEKGGLTASVTADATNTAKIELLGSKVAEYGKRAGSSVTSPKADGDHFETKDNVVNESDAHNELYNKA